MLALAKRHGCGRAAARIPGGIVSMGPGVRRDDE